MLKNWADLVVNKVQAGAAETEELAKLVVVKVQTEATESEGLD